MSLVLPGIAGKVWDSAFVLVDYLSTSMSEELHDKVILELGSGTGLAGCAVGLLQCRSITLTDMEVTLI